MKNLRLLPILLAGVGLTLSACTKEDKNNTSDTTVGDGDEAEDTDTDDGESSFGSSEDTAEDTATTFIPTTDIPDIASCDPFAQDCAEGEKCVAYASTGGTWDSNKCVLINGDGQPGDPCTYAGAVESTDSCGADSWCWDVNAEGMGTCTPFCTGTADAPVCEPMTSCSIANNGSITLCLTSCDPLLQDCAGEATGCFFDGSSFVCANAVGDIPTGEPCGFINDCAPGNICLAPESFPACAGSACCGAFCDMADPGTCVPDGTECTAFYEEGSAPPGYEDVGVCVIPG